MITEIHEGLYLGDSQDAVEHGKDYDIVMTVADNSPYKGDVIIPLIDGPSDDNEKNKRKFLIAVEMLCNLSYQRNARILVNCNAGISRAPSVVIGSIMRQYDVNYDYAYNWVKSLRPSIMIEPFFERILRSLEQ